MLIEKLPVISVVTVVLNRYEDIGYTLKSVCEQTYEKVEYIVIDGQSKDGTLDIIHRYRDCIDVLVSEKDEGIYDAMNKGLKLSKGDYVVFLNGGDSFHHKATLEEVVFHSVISKPQWPDLVFGECLLVDKNRNPIKKRSEFKNQTFPETLDYYSFREGTNVSHQAFIIHRKIAGQYDLRYKWSSDVDWMLRGIRDAEFVSRYDDIISEFVVGDATDKHKISTLTERFLVMSRHYGLIKTIYFHWRILVKRLKGLLSR